MIVTATEFKTNFGKYLDLLQSEVLEMVNPNVSAVNSISGLLAGKLPDNFDTKALRKEHLKKSMASFL